MDKRSERSTSKVIKPGVCLQWPHVAKCSRPCVSLRKEDKLLIAPMALAVIEYGLCTWSIVSQSRIKT